jgi:hypothetical protein
LRAVRCRTNIYSGTQLILDILFGECIIVWNVLSRDIRGLVHPLNLLFQSTGLAFWSGTQKVHWRIM